MVNGQPLVPATYGMRATGCTDSYLVQQPGDYEYYDYVPNYPALLADFENTILGISPDPQSFILTLSGTANGMVHAVFARPGWPPWRSILPC